MWVMALPAEKPLSMGGEVYLERILSVGFLPMTLAAKFLCIRLGRPDTPRTDLMLLRNVVTARAADESVRRDAFDARDLRMTGGTLPRSLRRHRVMSVVTRDTSLKRIVEHRIDLGESRGSGLIISMAEDTELSPPHHRRLVCRILYMRLRGPMTRFTINSLMITRLLFFRLVAMAISANCRAREDNIFCSFSFYGGLSMKLPVYQRGGKEEISHSNDTGNDHPDDHRKPFYLLRNSLQHTLHLFCNN